MGIIYSCLYSKQDNQRLSLFADLQLSLKKKKKKKNMHFLRSHGTLSLFLHGSMTCLHITNLYNENQGERTILTIS